MGGMGEERNIVIQHDFQFVSKHSPQVQSACSDLMQLLSLVHDDLRSKYTFQHRFVGSYSRDMITFDAKSNVGFDFDINIYPNADVDRFTAKQIKLFFKESLDKFSHPYDYDFAEDSTRVLTIKVKDRKNSLILHGVDFAFVKDYEDDTGHSRQKYIHLNKKQGEYSWSEQSSGFYMELEQFQWITDNGLKDELASLYIRMKNNNIDKNKHSRSLFAEAVNSCYNKYYNGSNHDDRQKSQLIRTQGWAEFSAISNPSNSVPISKINGQQLLHHSFG